MIGHYERGLSIELEREAEVPSDSEDYVYLEWFMIRQIDKYQSYTL